MEKRISRNTDNGFKNDIPPLFQKDLIKIMEFSKVQHWGE